MGCGMSMIKYILFLFNLLCAICGILIIVYGAVLFSSMSVDSKDLKEIFAIQTLPIALMVFGAIILIISFFGCCGAIRESYCMSMTYSVFLFILLILQIAIVVYLFISKKEVVKAMGDSIDEIWKKSKDNDNNHYMDAVQLGYKCCGRDGPTDYTLNVITNSFPKTCCAPGSESCSVLNSYGIGCRSAAMNWWDKNYDIAKIGGVVIGAIEISGLLMIATGIYTMIALDNTENVEAEYFMAILIIVLGSLILLIAFFGCCGAIRESFCMMGTYMVILLILLVLQIGIIVYIYTSEDEMAKYGLKYVDSAWNNRMKDPERMDGLQLRLQCCGNVSPNDYKKFGFGGFFPKTCCDLTATKNNTLQCTENTMYKIGCQEAHEADMRSHYDTIKYVNIGVAAVELAGIIAAGCLMNSIRNTKRRRRY